MEEAAKIGSPLAPRPPHFAPRAKRVIFLFMHGGPSSIDTFDPKERLDARSRQAAADQAAARVCRGRGRPADEVAVGVSTRRQSGIPVSDLFPYVRDRVDDLCVVRSMVGEGVDHGAALLQTFTGTSTFIATEHGLVGGLRSGNGEPESARLHHDQALAVARRGEELELGVSAGRLPGNGDRPRRAQGRRDQQGADRVPRQQETDSRRAALRARHAAEHQPPARGVAAE